MVLKIAENSVIFYLDELNYTYTSSEIRSEATRILSEQGIIADGILEIKSFLYCQKRIVFATYIKQSECCEIYCFESELDLIDAYTSNNRNIKGHLIKYNGRYYAALFEPCQHTLSEFADRISNGNYLYTFLSEHGIIMSDINIFSS